MQSLYDCGSGLTLLSCFKDGDITGILYADANFTVKIATSCPGCLCIPLSCYRGTIRAFSIYVT